MPKQEKILDPKKAKLTCFQYWRSLLQEIFDRYHSEDPKLLLFPWKTNSKDWPIPDSASLPNKFALFKPFLFGMNKDPRWNSSSWFQLQFGYDPKGPGLAIFPFNRIHKEWFDAGEHDAFFATLHDSDNEVTIGVLHFSGDFNDFHRLAECFHKS
jgi:hypothetical protein